MGRVFPGALLGNVHSPDRLVTVSLRSQSRVQVPEIALQIPPVLLLVDAVYPHRRFAALSLVCPPQGIHLNQVGQGVELSARLTLRSPRYPQKLW